MLSTRNFHEFPTLKGSEEAFQNPMVTSKTSITTIIIQAKKKNKKRPTTNSFQLPSLDFLVLRTGQLVASVASYGCILVMLGEDFSQLFFFHRFCSSFMLNFFTSEILVPKSMVIHFPYYKCFPNKHLLNVLPTFEKTDLSSCLQLFFLHVIVSSICLLLFLHTIYMYNINQITFIFEGQPPKTRPFPIKTRVIGFQQYIYICFV